MSPSIADQGFGEFRLIRGVFHCPVPFWGCARPTKSAALGCYQEMQPWSVGGDYDHVQYLAALRRKREFLAVFSAIARRTRPLSLFTVAALSSSKECVFELLKTSGIHSSSGLPGKDTE